MPSGRRQTAVHIDDAPPIGISTDHTGGKTGPATVYGSKERGYVVVNDLTGHVVQISDKTDPGWVPDSRILWE
jgi:filamentous hemagglutinin